MAQIVVLSTKTQKKYTLDVNGNTLSDLKAVMNNNGIDYQGMTFFEGRTKTELKSDQSQFPDNAVIRLTKSEKKITSGVASRTEAYAYIKENNLAGEVQKKFGRNFTQCKTSDLIDFINSKTTAAPKAKPAPVKTTPVKVEGVSDKESWIQQGVDAGFIDDDTAAQLRNAVKVESISAEDLKMFDF